jgi:hypothetical protein
VATSAPYARIELATGVGPGIGNDAVILVGRDGVTARFVNGHWARAQSTYDEATIQPTRVPQPVACTDDDHCFRVVSGALRVEESTDAGRTWTLAWELSDAKRDRWIRHLTEELTYDHDYEGDIRSDMACTSIYVEPDSGMVVVACGAMGFVSRDAAGTWTPIGFSGDGAELRDFDSRSGTDTHNTLMIVLFGWFILLLGAEAHAITHRVGGHAWPRALLAVLAVLRSLPVVAFRPGPERVDPTFSGWLCVPVLGAFVLGWFAVYRSGRRGFPWRVLLPAVAAPALAVGVHEALLAGRIEWMPGWTTIWATLGVGLVVGIVLGLTTPRPTPTG